MSINLFLSDLSLQSSIRNVVEDIKKKHNVIDVLINNAGVIKRKEEKTRGV